jgi:hypothetical protein
MQKYFRKKYKVKSSAWLHLLAMGAVHLRLQNVAKCCQMLPNVAKCCQMLPNVAKCCQMWPKMTNTSVAGIHAEGSRLLNVTQMLLKVNKLERSYRLHDTSLAIEEVNVKVECAMGLPSGLLSECLYSVPSERKRQRNTDPWEVKNEQKMMKSAKKRLKM